MEYKITESNEDPKQSKIQKLGVVVNFTFGEIEQHESMLAKVVKELKAKSEYEGAKMKNIETNHPFVLEMPEQDLFTAHMYQEAKSLVKVSNEKVVEIEKQLADYAEEKGEIMKQIPALASEPVLSPVQSEDINK